MSLPRRQRAWQIFQKLGSALFVVGVLMATPVAAKEEPVVELQNIALNHLPEEARSTHHLILAGGPFPYVKDGMVFGNRERRLPAKARGFYREYTVATPRSRNRGAKRIVCGGARPTEPDACYYTEDHYANFRRIVH